MMKIDKNSLRLENDIIYLFPLRVQDITEEYIDGLNDPEVNEYLSDVKQTIQTYESVKDYIVLNMKDPASILFGIFIKEHNNPFIGTVRLHNIDFYHYSANIGICIFAKRIWRKGYALRSLIKVKDFSFSTLKLHYLEAGVFTENKASMRLFRRAGFENMYKINQKFRNGDKFLDVQVFGAFNPDFDFSCLKNKQ